MPKETKRIDSIETKTSKKGDAFKVITAEGQKYSVWPNGKEAFAAASRIVPGETWNIEFDVQGQYKNVTRLSKDENVAPTQPAATSNQYWEKKSESDEARQVSIERQSSLHTRVRLLEVRARVLGEASKWCLTEIANGTGNVYGPENVIKVAEQYWNDYIQKTTDVQAHSAEQYENWVQRRKKEEKQ